MLGLIKTVRENQLVMDKGTSIRFSADFSAEILHAKGECNVIFKVLRKKNSQTRILYLPKLSFRIEGEKEYFPSKN